MSTSGLDFYKNLRAFSDFNAIADASHFRPAPDSWVVIVADVRGSTRAIQQGRYKQVNLIGAASITCVLNAIKDYEFPFVFGGDGSTMLVPEHLIAQTKTALQRLQSTSQRKFHLELRVGLVPIRTLTRTGHSIEVGKYELSPGNYLAQFRGTGLTQAETLVKDSSPECEILKPDLDQRPPELAGLSCRLNPVAAKNGTILSILMKAQDPAFSDQITKAFLKQLHEILDDDLRSASPIRHDSIRWSWLPRNLGDELDLAFGSVAKSRISRLFKLVGIIIETAMIKLDLQAGAFSAKKYKKELVLNSDYHKFDETLRMVIDCSPTQSSAIEAALQDLHAHHKVFFGLHRTQHAIMTCVVPMATEGKHVHFIDGSDGGYAMAATEMKRQVSESKIKRAAND